MSCKYCRTIPDSKTGFFPNIPPKNEEDAKYCDMQVFVEDNDLMICTKDITIDYHVNYCPMCGEKLK